MSSLNADRQILLADQFNHSVAAINPATNDLLRFGGQGSALDATTGLLRPHEETLGGFERPHGVDVDAEGNIYIADTWNFRVQVLTPDGTPLRAWGSRAEAGVSAQVEPVDGFWGPRDMLVSEWRVYVADTGNKRVRVYTLDGEYLLDIGCCRGPAEGELNEPAGLAVDAAGTAVRGGHMEPTRIAMFDRYVWRVSSTSFRVRAWYNDQGNRPYLAVDDEREHALHR
jgi:DNA-binding beta-propeller fold protein YncE